MRPRKPWFRSSNDAWYVEIEGKQVLLAKGKANRAKAEATYHRLMAGLTPTAVSGMATAVLCDLFLDYSQAHNSSETYAWHKHYLTLFCREYGRILCTEIKPFHLTRWLDSNKQWTGARRSAQAIVKRVFSWGKSEGLISFDPLAHIKNSAIKRRERVLSSDGRAASGSLSRVLH